MQFSLWTNQCDEWFVFVRWQLTVGFASLELIEVGHADCVAKLVSDGRRVDKDGELEAVCLRLQLCQLVWVLAADTPKPDFTIVALKLGLKKRQEQCYQ